MTPVADTREAGGTDIRPVACLEIEASSPILPGAVPIEVAISHVGSGTTKSWLVAPPHRRWGEAAWDPPERRPHTISPNMLLAEGHPVEIVRAELAAAAAGHLVVSDSVLSDGALLRALYGEAPPFELGSISEVMRSLVRHLEREDALLVVGRATNEAFARDTRGCRTRSCSRGKLGNGSVFVRWRSREFGPSRAQAVTRIGLRSTGWFRRGHWLSRSRTAT